MCGIAGYIGKREDAAQVLLEALRRLEYRGYDSSGIAYANGQKIITAKAVGEIEALSKKLVNISVPSSMGIAHTRWATHGGISEKNAHPHCDCKGEIWIVHNGTVENYDVIKKRLIQEGHEIISDTDTELIAHLIETHFAGDLKHAVEETLEEIQGAYGIAVISTKDPGKIVIARNGSPLAFAKFDSGYLIASDASPMKIIERNSKIVFLEDGDIAVFSKKVGQYQHHVYNQKCLVTRDEYEDDDWHETDDGKGKYPHYMLKEICEGPRVVREAMRGRIVPEEGLVKLGGLEDQREFLTSARRIVFVSCGTALYAARTGQVMLKDRRNRIGIAVDANYASEIRYGDEIFDPKYDAVFAISQSGETADTRVALEMAKGLGVRTFGIVNAVGSTIARMTDAGVYNRAGLEIGVASTKAFVSQLTILAMLTVFLGRLKEGRMELERAQQILEELSLIPGRIEEILGLDGQIKALAQKYSAYKNFLFLGRGYNYPIALEGALKLKEITYRHAEGYPAGEMKHGPLALIDESFPTVVIVPKDTVRKYMLGNINELKARKGPVLAIANYGDDEVEKLADDVIFIPETSHEMLSPLLTVVPLHLFAYHMAVELGRNVDKPRNLAKSVTVE